MVQRDFVKTKILVGLIILILIIGGFLFWQFQLKKEVVPAAKEKLDCLYECCIDETYQLKVCPVGYGCKANKCIEITKPSTEVKVYKGIWLPTLLLENPDKIASKMQKFKDIGGNTVFIQSSSPQPENWREKAKEVFPPELIKKIEEVIPIEKELLIATIQTAHINGLKVGLTMTNPMCVPSKEVPQLEEIDLEALNSKIIEDAKLAEKYEVEFFAPLGEPDNMFGPSASATWGQEILPKIREVYHGKVIWKGGGPMNLSGYDYIGFTISAEPDMTLEEFSQRVDKYLDAVLGFAERDRVMITEIWLEEPRWSEEEVARAYEIVFEKGKDRVIGFFAGDFLEVELPGMPLVKEEIKTEEVIRKWFTEILK